MRQALRGLTTRGRSFLAAAAAAGALARSSSASATCCGSRCCWPRCRCWPPRTSARPATGCPAPASLEPARVPVGSTARVLLRLSNLSRLPTGTLLLEDRLPYALGSRPRLVLERLGGQRASTVAYTVRAEVRGRYEVGPLVVRLTDPFGLCELTRSFPRVGHLTVIPQVVPLPNVRLAGEYAGSGDSRARSVAVHGEDDIATREYRHGDDLRRVHWRSTARTGELMVRREEQPWESRATIVLDTRRHGAPRRGPDVQLRVGRLGGREHRRAPAPQRLQDPPGHRRRRRPRRHRARRRRRAARRPRRGRRSSARRHRRRWSSGSAAAATAAW